MNDLMLMSRIAVLEDRINILENDSRTESFQEKMSQWIPDRVDVDTEMETLKSRSLQRDSTYDSFRLYDFLSPTAVTITDWDSLNGSADNFLIVARQEPGPGGLDVPSVKYLDIHQLGTDEKVKVTSNDTTADYLYNKLAAGAYITLTELNDGGDEDVEIAVGFPALDLDNIITGTNGQVIYSNGGDWQTATWVEYMQWLGVNGVTITDWTTNGLVTGATVAEVSIYVPVDGPDGAIHHVRVLGIDEGAV